MQIESCPTSLCPGDCVVCLRASVESSLHHEIRGPQLVSAADEHRATFASSASFVLPLRTAYIHRWQRRTSGKSISTTSSIATPAATVAETAREITSTPLKEGYDGLQQHLIAVEAALIAALSTTPSTIGIRRARGVVVGFSSRRYRRACGVWCYNGLWLHRNDV